MTENKRFEHKWNMLGMQFICYDCKDVLLGTFADKEGVEHIVDLLNELDSENKSLKQQLKSEHQMLDNAILLERTRMGQNSLKQYKEAIQ